MTPKPISTNRVLSTALSLEEFLAEYPHLTALEKIAALKTAAAAVENILQVEHYALVVSESVKSINPEGNL